jgi:transposase-like protein
VVTEAKLTVARQLLDDGVSLGQAAATIGIGRSTLYRHLVAADGTAA